MGPQSVEVKRAPIGSRPDRYRDANVSLTTATGALVATSEVARSRPRRSRIPAVARYPGLYQLMAARSGWVGDGCLPSTWTLSSQPPPPRRASMGKFPTSAAFSMPGIVLAAARSSAIKGGADSRCGYAKPAITFFGSRPRGTAENRCKLRKRSPVPVASCPVGQVAPARGPTHEEERRHVGAGDEEQQDDCSECRLQGRRRISGQGSLQRFDGDAIAAGGAHDGIDLRPGGRGADVRTEPSESVQAVPGGGQRLLGPDVEREKELGLFGARKDGARGEDADDHNRHVLNLNHASKDGGIRAQVPSPERIADDRYLFPASEILGRLEGAAARGEDPQRSKDAGAHAGRPDA